VVLRLIYNVGDVVGEDCEEIQANIEQFNTNPGIQKKCQELDLAGLKYLWFSSLNGTGMIAQIDIPANTELSYILGQFTLQCAI
jgi:hypothetical protein